MKEILDRMVARARAALVDGLNEGADALREGVNEGLAEAQRKITPGRTACDNCKGTNTRAIERTSDVVCLTCGHTTRPSSGRVVQGSPKR